MFNWECCVQRAMYAVLAGTVEDFISPYSAV